MKSRLSFEPIPEPRARLREDNDALTDGWGLSGQEDLPTPYQKLCVHEYSVIDVHSRPNPHDFLAYDPVVARETWKSDKPAHLTVDVKTDSAVDIMRKLRMRASGGIQVIDSHAATITDQFTVSNHSQTATPTMAGSQILVKLPDMSRMQAVVSTLEDGEDPEKVINQTLTRGSRVVSTVLGKLALGQRPIIGEKTASVFEPRESIPQLNTPDGARLDAFASLAMRHPEPMEVADLISTELAELSGIELPDAYLKLAKEYAGNPYVRAAALGDRKYHAMATHVSQAGCASIRFAPLTSKSFGEHTPPNWQSLRAGARSIGHLNIALDPTLRRSSTVVDRSMKLGYDIAKDSLAPFVLSRNSLTVMRYLQASIAAGSMKRGLMTALTQKRIFADAIDQQGGVKDLMRYNEVKAELDEIWEEDVGVEEGEEPVHHLKLNLGHARVVAKSAIIRPAFYTEKRHTQDDMEMTRGKRRGTLNGFTHESLITSGFETVISIGALLRYAVSISYMSNKPGVRLAVAIYIKQWNMISEGRSIREARNTASVDGTVCLAAMRIFTPDVLKMMRTLVPYCSLHSTANVVRIMRVSLPGVLIDANSDAKFNYAMKEYMGLEKASNERCVLRKLCGKIVHAGMSDSGLMFTITAKLKKSMSLAEIMLEHIRYKIGIWANNYQANLSLYRAELDESVKTPEWYKQIVIWQQKLKAMKSIEVIGKGSRIHVLVKDFVLCKMMVESYVARYNTIESRLKKEAKDRVRDNKATEDESNGIIVHPWGDKNTGEDITSIIMSGIDVVLDFLESKDPTEWTINPRELYELVDDSIQQVIYGVRTAIEEVDVSFTATINGVEDEHTNLLPDHIDKEISAKFQFSLADPPKAIDPRANDRGDNTVRGRLPPMRNPAGPPSRRMMGGIGGVSSNPMAKARLMMKQKKMTKGRIVVKPKMASIGEVIAQASPVDKVRICTWLTAIMRFEISVENTVEVLPREYHCQPGDTQLTTALLLSNYTDYVTRKLRAAQETQEYDDDMA